MGVLFALGSALFYGFADFTGGLLARRMSYAVVAVVGQLGGLVATVLAALLLSPHEAGLGDLGWGALSGVGTGVGMVFLYRGLSRTAMSVTVPVSAIGGSAFPVVVGVAFLGERPSITSWVGVVVGLPALWLVSRDSRDTARPTGRLPWDALVAGLGIAVQYLALAQPAADAGLWPLAVGRLTATLTIVPLIGHGRHGGRPSPRMLLAAGATGTLAAVALVCYTLAARQELLTIAVVLSSLYPVIPVLLGLTALHERLTRVQVVGLLAAAASVALITAG